MGVEGRVSAIYICGLVVAAYIFHNHSELWGVAAGLFTLLAANSYRTDKRLDALDESILRLKVGELYEDDP